MPSHISLAIISVNLLLIFISIYWSVTSWRIVRDHETQPPFLNRTCLVTKAAITTQLHRYRNEFAVRNFTIPSEPAPQGITIAYRYGSDRYNQTAQQARAFAATIPVNKTHVCFVQTPASDLRQFRYSVSMTPVHVHVTREELDMAIVSTAFAVLAVFTMLFSIPCLLARPTLYHTPVSLTAPMQPATMTLTRAQIDRVCQVAPAQPTDGSLDACAICLDDETGVSAQLPCKHRYHVLCIRGWLLRGGTTCPLCAYNLAENEDEDGDEEKDVKEGDMVRGSSRLDLLSARLSSRLSQRTSLRFRTGTGEGHGDGLSARVSARLSARLSSREGPADGSPTEMGAIGEVRLEGMSNTGPS